MKRYLFLAVLLLARSAAAQVASNGSPIHVIVDTLPVSGGGLTDTELRATPVPVSIPGTVTFANTSIAITGSVAVTGTFWQVTQPVSLATLPALAAGTALVGKVGIDQTTPGTTNAVQANAGTNLNTSLLALEAGGNLASIKTDVDKIPSQGQALAAVSMPVVLTAIQQAALTPPAAITGYGLESTQLLQATAANQTTTIASLAAILAQLLTNSSAPGTAASTAALTVQGAFNMAPLVVSPARAFPLLPCNGLRRTNCQPKGF